MEAPAEKFRGYDVISAAMSSDIPKDLFDRFATSRYGNSQVFSGHYDDYVANEDLEGADPPIRENAAPGNRRSRTPPDRQSPPDNHGARGLSRPSAIGISEGVGFV